MDNNQIRVANVTASQGLQISTQSINQTISATNNKALYYAEQAKKYKDEAKTMRDLAQYYAEQNSDVTVGYINGIKTALETEIDTKQDVGNYALSSELPTNISDLTDDTATNPIDKADTLTGLTATVTELNYCDGVTSNIQTQLDGKQDSLGYTPVNKAGDTMTGNLTINNTNGAFKVTTNDWSDTAPTTTQYKIPLQVVNSNDSSQIAGSMFAQSYETTGLLKSFIQVQRTVNGSNIYKSISVGIDANGNAVYSPVQLITSYVSGTSGYNIWSNGYCEQWGKSSAISVGSTPVIWSVTFVKTFKNADYNFQVTSYGGNSGRVRFGVEGAYTGSMSGYISCDYTSTERLVWEASGYLASGQY